jgi:hypothetical protein
MQTLGFLPETQATSAFVQRAQSLEFPPKYVDIDLWKFATFARWKWLCRKQTHVFECHLRYSVANTGAITLSAVVVFPAIAWPTTFGCNKSEEMKQRAYHLISRIAIKVGHQRARGAWV